MDESSSLLGEEHVPCSAAADKHRFDILLNELSWRGVALCLAIAHGGLLWRDEVVALAGQGGVRPCVRNADAALRDLPPFTRWLYFPSLLYFTGASDSALRTLAVAGLLGALIAMLLMPSARLARAAGFGLGFVMLASMGNLCDGLWIATPWDCFLLEASSLGVLAALATGSGDETSAKRRALLRRAVAWLRRWLLFRVVGGFAKVRFAAGGRLGYSDAPGSVAAAASLREFFTILPMTHRGGWLAAWYASTPLMRLAHAFYWLVEVFAPLAFILPPSRGTGIASALTRAGARATIVLMVGIVAGGNFGWFNLLTAVMCLPLCVTSGDDCDGSSTSSRAAIGIGAAAGVYTTLSMLLFLPAEWASPALLYWEGAVPLLLLPLRSALRVLTGWRLAASYGVIPPSTGVRKVVAVFDVGWHLNGSMHWSTLPYRHQVYDGVVGVARPPPWCVTPFFPRAEFSMWYTQRNHLVRRELLLAPLAATHARTSASWEESVAHALLRPGFRGATALFDVDSTAADVWPSVRGIPQAVRLRYVEFRRTTSARGGDYWQTRTVRRHVVTADRAASSLPTPDEGAWWVHAPGLWELTISATRYATETPGDSVVASTAEERAALAHLAERAFRGAADGSRSLPRVGDPAAAAGPLLWRWTAAALGAPGSHDGLTHGRLAEALRAQHALLRAVHAERAGATAGNWAVLRVPLRPKGASERWERLRVKPHHRHPVDALRTLWAARAHGASRGELIDLGLSGARYEPTAALPCDWAEHHAWFFQLVSGGARSGWAPDVCVPLRHSTYTRTTRWPWWVALRAMASVSPEACRDSGPWHCVEAGCPGRTINCAFLAARSACASTFGQIWRAPPPGIAANQTIVSACRLSCEACGI